MAVLEVVMTSDQRQHLVGTLRRFGEIGPVYEIVSVEDDEFAQIRLVADGQTARYAFREVLNDPEA